MLSASGVFVQIWGVQFTGVAQLAEHDEISIGWLCNCSEPPLVGSSEPPDDDDDDGDDDDDDDRRRR